MIGDGAQPYAAALEREQGAREPMDWTPEWSRRARGVATYAAIRELGRRGVAAFFGGVTWREQRCMRISVCNWRTNEEDVRRAVAAVAAAIAAAR